MKKMISVDGVIDTPHCWAELSIKDYAQEHGDGCMVPLETILDDKNVRIMDKMWVVCNFDVLSPNDSHELATLYALHVITASNVAARRAIEAKLLWIKDEIDDEELELAEKEAWDEAKYYPKSRAAAFAAKKDPKNSLLLSAAIAGEWFSNEADATEMVWQWEQMKERIND